MDKGLALVDIIQQLHGCVLFLALQWRMIIDGREAESSWN